MSRIAIVILIALLGCGDDVRTPEPVPCVPSAAGDCRPNEYRSRGEISCFCSEDASKRWRWSLSKAMAEQMPERPR